MDYKEKLRLAKEALESGSYDKDTIEYIFPELRESKDEKIRQKFIKLVKMSNEVGGFALHKWEADEMLAWLEKQGEQKPSTEVKPKFHEGDWIVDNIGVAHQIEKTVLNVTNNTFGYDIVGGGYFNDDSDVHLWTIQDVRDGDVLYSLDSKQPFIFKHRNSNEQAEVYCGINIYGKFFVGNTKDCIITTDKYVPATKSQRDTLMKAMKEAGYEWLEKTHELKKIEQKPQRIISAEAKEALYDKPTDEEMKELLRTEYEKGRADTIAEMEKDWSEEDETNLTNTIIMLKEGASHHFTNFSIVPCVDWLKQLKQRIGG